MRLEFIGNEETRNKLSQYIFQLERILNTLPYHHTCQLIVRNNHKPRKSALSLASAIKTLASDKIPMLVLNKKTSQKNGKVETGHELDDKNSYIVLKGIKGADCRYLPSAHFSRSRTGRSGNRSRDCKRRKCNRVKLLPFWYFIFAVIFAIALVFGFQALRYLTMTSKNSTTMNKDLVMMNTTTDNETKLMEMDKK